MNQVVPSEEFAFRYLEAAEEFVQYAKDHREKMVAAEKGA
jgi:hypothetical protein